MEKQIHQFFAIFVALLFVFPAAFAEETTAQTNDNYRSVDSSEYDISVAASGREISAEAYGAAPPQDFDPRQMIVGRLFEKATAAHPADFDPQDYAELCPDTEKMVDKAIAKMKEYGMFDTKAICSEIESRSATCKKRSESQCERIKTGDFHSGNGPKLSCPPNKEQLVTFCVEQSKKQEARFTKQMERMKAQQGRECDRQYTRQERECQRQAEREKRDEERWQQEEERQRRDDERRYDDQRRQQEYRQDAPQQNTNGEPAPVAQQPQTDAQPATSETQTEPVQETQPSATGSETQTTTESGSTTSSSSGSSNEITGNAIEGNYEQRDYPAQGAPAQPYGGREGGFREPYQQRNDFGGQPQGFGGQPQGGYDQGPPRGGGYQGGYAQQGSYGGQQGGFGGGPGPMGGGMGYTCDMSKDEFVSECKAQFEENIPDYSTEAKRHCEENAEDMLYRLEDMCAEREDHYAECVEQSTDACSFAEEAATACNAITESEIREVMIEQAEYMCRSSQYRTGGSAKAANFKHLKGAPSAQTVVPKLLKARESAPEEFKPILDKETDNFLKVSDELEAIEKKEDEKGVGYQLKKLLGLAAEQERKDAEAIKHSSEKLDATIKNLEKIAEQLSDPTAKASIEEEVKSLKERKTALEEVAEKKHATAKGILSYFTGGSGKDEAAAAN